MMTTHAEPVFHARGLTKTYAMGEVPVHALRGVDLDLYAGEFVVLLGASGSGKSTLLNILGGLDSPSSGEVVCQGHTLTGADEAALTRFRRESVGFVFQFYNLIPSLTARENVQLVTDIAQHPQAIAAPDIARRHPHAPAALGQSPHHLTPDKARAAENRNQLLHGRSKSIGRD